jgi:DNA-binding LytR/AlgR family response regulator
MNIVIVEDEKYTAEMIIRLIKQYNPSYRVLCVLASVEETVKWFLQQNEMVDLVLMDIQLTDGSSFEIFEKVRIKTPIIFITAFDEFALNAFKVNSVDYLLKPIDYSDIEKAFQKYSQLKDAYQITDNRFISTMIQPQQKSYKSRFLVRTGDQYRFIFTNEVAYFHFEEGVIFAQLLTEKRVIIDETLDELETLVDPSRFFRINRKMIIAIDAILSIHPYFNRRMTVHLKPGKRQEVISRERVNEFKAWLNS